MSAPTDGEAPQLTGDQAPQLPGGADSAGLPWAGRRLVDSTFADDHGAPDPQLLALLRRAGPRSGDDEATLLALLASARLLVPLVAARAPFAGDHPPSGGAREELAGVTLTGPGGSRALPVFTGLPALAAWDAAARPVPVTAGDAARAALAQDCDLVVLDPASPYSAVLRLSMLDALAHGRPWTPACRDPGVAQAAAAALADEPAVVRHELGPGGPGSDTVVVTVRLRPGLDADQVQRLTGRVSRRLGAAALLRSRVDELVLRISAAEEE